METVVDRLFREFEGLVNHLEEAGEISLKSAVEESFTKSFLLAAASFFEHRLGDEILAFVQESTNENKLLYCFVKNKGLSRQFHTFFDWDKRNANKFFSLFGEEFKSFMENEIQGSADLGASVRAFLEIGLERNRLVHQNFGSYTLEKTAREIYDLYRSALDFINIVPQKMRECLELRAP